ASEVQLHRGKPLSFVFKSTVKSSQLARLDLQLHALDFVGDTIVPGLLGEEPATVNLWVATEAVPFDVTGLPGDHYLIDTRTPLEPGSYAFHTQGVLTSKDIGALDKLPREMRVAYPFEVR
ncbi:MAG: hypothetical protein QGG40_21675, partial [Myxococcota bacterium]|nr:hypothetical protein [Myxococcota bacterium]